MHRLGPAANVAATASDEKLFSSDVL